MTRLRSCTTIAVFASLALLVWAGDASASEHRHTVREGETLSSISRTYYGAAWKAVYIESRNKLEDSQINSGQRLVIPASWKYTIRRGDSLARLAKKYLGETERYTQIMKENRISDPNVPVGKELLMPFHLYYEVADGDSLGSISRRFYRTSRKAGELKTYNALENLEAGTKLIIPVFDPSTLDVKQREPPVGDAPPAAPPPPDPVAEPEIEDAPVDISATLAAAVQEYKTGSFSTACPTFQTLFEALESLEIGNRVTIISHLGFCAIAHGDVDAAKEYFATWIDLEPKAKLDPVLYSPKIIDVFNIVRAGTASQ